MVIKDILAKANKTDPNDPKVKELREKLAKLKGEQTPQQPTQSAAQKTSDAPKPPTPQQPTNQVAAQKKTPKSSTDEDELARLAKASDAERRAFAQEQNPRLRIKEERTHKLVAKQVGELIELTTDIQKRLGKAEQENKTLHQEIERLEKHNKEITEKMQLIDGRLEKFMGLYEIITNQYNPFAEQENTQQSPPPSKKLKVADELGGAEAEVEYVPGEMSTENKQKIDQLLAELEAQEKEKKNYTPEQVEASEVREEELSTSLRDELHEMLGGFEQRMKHYLDESVQTQLHETVAKLESVLNEEIKEAVGEHLEQLTSHDDVVDSALKELEALESSASDAEAYKEQESLFVDEVRFVDEQIKAIPPSLYFRLQSGRVLKSKQDLVDALADMSPAVFSHHVNESHNDFADWLELALKDPVGELLRGKSREEMLVLLSEQEE